MDSKNNITVTHELYDDTVEFVGFVWKKEN